MFDFMLLQTEPLSNNILEERNNSKTFYVYILQHNCLFK